MPLRKNMKFVVVPFQSGFRVMSSDGAFFSNTPMTAEMAKRQQRALYAKARKGHIHHGGSYTYMYHQGKPHLILRGEGFIGNFFGKVKQLANKAVNVARTVVQRVVAVSKGIRNDYPPSARETLAQFGDGQVKSLLVRREPLASFINTALNFISKGRWGEIKSQLPYDKLYHLSMVATVVMPDGREVPIVIEKNEVINISTDYKSSGKMEFVNIPVSQQLTLQEMMDRAQQMGGSEYFKYDAFTNNCQMFIIGILNASGLNSTPVQTFVLQDVDTLLTKLPSYTSPLARTLTNLGGLANVAMYGEGEDDAEAEDQSTEAKGMRRKLEGRNTKKVGGVRLHGRMCLTGGAGEEEQAPPPSFEEYLQSRGFKKAPSPSIQTGENSFREVVNPNDTVQFDKKRYDELIASATPRVKYETRRAKYPALKLKPYDEYLEQLKEVAKSRSTTNVSSKGRQSTYLDNLKRQNELHDDYIKKYPALQDVVCKIGADLEPARGREVVSKAECDDRHIRRNKKIDDANPFSHIMKGITTVGDVLTNIVPMPGIVKQGWKFAKDMSGQKSYLDGEGKTRRESVLKKFGMENRGHTLKELSQITKVPLKTLMEVYKRGIGAYKTNPQSVRLKGSFVKNVDAPMSAKLSKEQWAQSRVYSFLDGNTSHDNDLRKNTGGGRGASQPMERFKSQLEEFGVSPVAYLRKARASAKKNGYDPKAVQFADDDKHKLMLTTDDGRVVKFGAVGMGDFILHSSRGKAEGLKAQKAYLARATKIKGDWKSDKFSPNNLAINILW